MSAETLATYSNKEVIAVNQAWLLKDFFSQMFIEDLDSTCICHIDSHTLKYIHITNLVIHTHTLSIYLEM